MNEKRLVSNAKVNLFLKVGKKNKIHKLHNIQSIVYLLNLHDKIKVKKINKNRDKVVFYGKFNRNVNKKNNTVSKSLHLLRKKGFIKKKDHYEISIKKNIPVFSGFGGGSSNAAVIIRNFLKAKDISKKNIDYFCDYLGSDLRLFFGHKKIFQINLNNIKKIQGNYSFYFLLVYPYLKSSTKIIYSKVYNYEKIKYNYNFNRVTKPSMLRWLKFQNNALEKIVISKFPVVSKILKELSLLKNCQFSRITGSGSACFGVFLNKKDAAAGLVKIKKKFPKFWFAISRTI